MSEFTSRLSEEIKAAMKAKDQTALVALRALKTALTNAAVEKGNLHAELTEDEIQAVIRKQLKQRQDSLSIYQANNRPELAAKEEAEIAILSRYLPAQLSAEELAGIITASIAEVGATSKRDMGKVMAVLQPKVAGRADGKAVAQAVSAELAKLG